MKVPGKNQQTDLFGVLPNAIASIKKNLLTPFFVAGDLTRKYANEKPPLRAELFTAEQMRQYAKTLAKNHALSDEGASEQLLKRMAENETVLLEVHSLLTDSIKQNNRIVPAAEWLLDNFYLIEEQIYTGKKHLPKGYSRGLPQLLRGPSAGLPRVYDIAVEIVSHSDGRVDLNSLSAFITAYQETTQLKLGELWAVPIMLRLALIENLRRLAIQIVLDIRNKTLADYWADEMTRIAETDPKSLILVIADMARSEPPMVSSFVAELSRKLIGKGAELALPLSWIEQRLSENGLTSNELIHLENQNQAADQVSISNSISSLRFVSSNDWREFVETISIVEHTLREDPDGLYGRMDFYTRDHYRHAVERIAKASSRSEEDIAKLVIGKARQRKETDPADPRSAHVGYFLVDKGVAEVEKEVKARVSAAEYSRKIFNRMPVLLYAGSILALTCLFTWMLVLKAWQDGLYGWMLWIPAFLSFAGISQLSVTLVNWISTLLARPHTLSRLDFSKGIPADCHTLVAVPAMLSSTRSLDALVESIEVRFLANRDVNLQFALVTDFTDAPEETMPGDASLLQAAKNRIIALNKKYERSRNDTFFLFHRPRRYNEHDRIWMGFERKRGKLAALNNALLGRPSDDFSVIIGEKDVYTSIRYVITLDSDTQLPRDSAWKMIGTIAHPLNHPVYSEKKMRVTDGYTILQPRVSNSLPAADSSLYAKMHGNEPGTDPYTRAVSDVYQDLFQEGSFIGKGIYDVAAFEKVLGNRLPANRILSHDLLEGSYARSGLMSDVQLYEEYPTSFEADMKRRHRWIRGDWQIARWLFPVVPGGDGRGVHNPISVLSGWKIADNLRRSLVQPAIVLLLVYGWLFSAAWFWTMVVVLMILIPAAMSFCWDIYKKPRDVTFLQHTIFAFRSVFNRLIQQLAEFVFLPYEAFMNTHAILLTGWRLLTRRKLLEWNPSENHVYHRPENIFRSYLHMWFAPLFALGMLVYMSWRLPAALFAATPLLMLWILSPAVSWYISRTGVRRKLSLSPEHDLMLRKLSRKIWSFFEIFAGEEDNWLPPDNYQEQPVARVAHRTSPTNIGLSLLSSLTAYDFGYVSMEELVERITNIISTLQELERFRGHFYNWYDTQSLAPLHPKYISTVDSGNLVGHLLVLKQGLIALKHNKIWPARNVGGLLDTLYILIEKTGERHPVFEPLKAHLETASEHPPATLPEARAVMDRAATIFGEIQINITEEEEEIAWWHQRLNLQITNLNKEIIHLAPWLLLPEAPEKFHAIPGYLPAIPSFYELSRIEMVLLPRISEHYSGENTEPETEWLNAFRSAVIDSSRKSKEYILMLERLSQECVELSTIEYDFLYDHTQHLLSIGYNAEEHRCDNSFYDLLASEVRLGVFVAIAQGQLPQEAWFALGRQLTSLGTDPILLSWSGSMFEYLMPSLVMPSYENTLLDRTNKTIVQKQIEYGRKKNVPWGISESGYNMFDANLNYQYRAFGVPGIGFKRGLAEDLVISPYSTVMSMVVAPQQACDNLEIMREKGFEGRYGFYEAVDYTPTRLPRGKSHVVIQSFMAHHQGMSLLSLSYLLLEKIMVQRFSAEVQFKTVLLLLQERIPRITTFYSPGLHAGDIGVKHANEMPTRVINTPNTPVPEVQLLSNGRYHVMVTNAGGGYSRWKNLAVNRWREDSTRDNLGSFCFIRDTESNVYWSSSHQPSLQVGENYEAVFSQGRAEFRRHDHLLETHTEIVVSPEDDVELRRVHITNRSRKKRYIEVTSYSEVVLSPAAADDAHPAFNNLFVQTEIIPQRQAIICTRRPRSANEQTPWMFHLMKVYDVQNEGVFYETDRAGFIGRGNTIHTPVAMTSPGTLGGGQGSVLDPIVAIQYRIMLEPQQTASVDMVFGIADTREICTSLLEKYQDRHLANRAFELAWTHSQVILRQINAVESDAQLYGRLAGSIIFANASLRTDPSVIMKNHRGQSALWSYSISGDLPIVVLQLGDSANLELARQLVRAHAYWRLKGLAVDLVIWNEDHGGYRQTLHNQLQELIGAGADIKDQPGGIFIRSADQLSNEDRILFQTVARIVISDSLGTLEEQLSRRSKLKGMVPYFSPNKFHATVTTQVPVPDNLQFFNGTGGFSTDGKEYVIITSAGQVTPAPWANVLANPSLGTVVSESGQAYSWIDNAHEFRLTPWNDDPVCDSGGEAFYLRDEESGRFWSPTPLPRRSASRYITRHGFGYSVFEHSEDGIRSEVWMYVDIEAPVKFISIRLRNESQRPRKLSATGYVEWVLGDLKPKSQMHVTTAMDVATGILLASNLYNTELEGRTAFFDVDEAGKTYTCDRTEFVGRNGTLANPDAMSRARLSGKSGAALDPCAALQVMLDLSEGEERQVIFKLGAGKNEEDAREIVRRFKGSGAASSSLDKVRQYWTKALGAITLKTPDPALNILSNGWLNYQSLASRLWARSGYYQSGGAFGFRDQLQDVLSLVYSEPSIVRQQILLCASRQFREGDVQHWWHPPAGRGVRTTCSDDYLWLPFVAARYTLHTGDNGILDEQIHFLEGRPLNVDEESYYDLPIRSDYAASLYEHCVKAIEHGLRMGQHGLPLMGSGDWNDGMDKVGEHGKGESVWLAFFLYNILVQFIDLATMRNDEAFAGRCRQYADTLRANIEKNAWDGKWYRRAYFDDGSPLGSEQNPECKIDSIAQSWSVLSGAAGKERSLEALQSADDRLVRKEVGLIQLFDPPFDKSPLNPGYIKGYVPGVRENGGQYTHAAVWLVMAFAASGNRKRTWELLQMINPLNRSATAEKIAMYKVEPYVVAADVYMEPRHKGRGGWTWYTGSAGWMYQLIVEWFIGLKLEKGTLRFAPCLPPEWPTCQMDYRFGNTTYHIEISSSEQPSVKIFLNGAEQPQGCVTLTDDGGSHEIKVTI